MALFDFFKIYVFSDVTGIVLLDGSPVEGAEIIRTADHEEDKVYSDRTKSGADGRFSFPAISTYSLRPLMLGTIIRQEIKILHNGKAYLAWETTKHNKHLYGELNNADADNPIKLDLSCELTDDPEKETIVELKYLNALIKGVCRWK